MVGGFIYIMCMCFQLGLSRFGFSFSGMGRFLFKVVRLPKKNV